MIDKMKRICKDNINIILIFKSQQGLIFGKYAFNGDKDNLLFTKTNIIKQLLLTLLI